MSIPFPTVPTYTVELPVSKQKVKYRPFLVKEEKILLLAKTQETTDEIVESIIQVMTLCTFEKVNIAKLPVADVEYLFVKVRERSIGEQITGDIDCKACNHKQPYLINLDKVKVIDLKTNNVIAIDDHTVVTMKYPTINNARGLEKYSADDVSLALTASLIESITIDDQLHDAKDSKKEELVEWLENCTEQQIEMFGKFLQTLPKVVYSDEVVCKNCGETIHVYTEGVESFFS